MRNVGEIMLAGQPPAPLFGAIYGIYQAGAGSLPRAYFNKYPFSSLLSNHIDFSPATVIIAGSDRQSLAYQKNHSPVFAWLSLEHE